MVLLVFARIFFSLSVTKLFIIIFKDIHHLPYFGVLEFCVILQLKEFFVHFTIGCLYPSQVEKFLDMKYGLNVLATFPCMYQNTGAVSERIVLNLKVYCY